MLCLNITFYIDKQPRKWYAEKNLSVEVVNLSTTDYRNQEALNGALNIYRTYMRAFIITHLRKIPNTNVEDVVIDSVNDRRAGEIDRSLNESDRDIRSLIDIDDFPLLINANWEDAFEGPLNDDRDFRNQLWLIKTCRDQSWAHPPEGDAESEGTRAYLFLITDVLRKIRKPDKQSEVEAIRDELFPDTAERLEKAEEDNVKYKKSLAEAEKRLATAESEKNKYVEKNAALSKQVDEKESQRKKLDRQLKGKRTQNDKYKKDIAGAKQRLKESEAAQADYKNRLETKLKELKDTEVEKNDYKERFETTSKELEEAKTEWQACEDNLKAKSDQLEDAVGAWMTSMESLTAMRKLFMTATIGEPKIQAVFPPIETDAIVRILDRRNVDKKNFLLALLKQKQPTIIYVQSEERIDQLLTLVGPEKADVIGKCNERTSEAEEKEILGKLENGELIAVVSNTAFSTLAAAHCIEHFVFCHLVPGLDEFYKQCEPAFTSGKNTYLHLIYNGKEDIKGLNLFLEQEPPDREKLGEHYRELKKHVAENRDFNEHVKTDVDLKILKLQFETMLTIFEELRLLEQNEGWIKFLPTPSKENSLYNSETYCDIVEKLKQEIVDFYLKQPIEQIWEILLKELNVDNEQILEASNIHEVRAFQDAIRDSEAQSKPSTDAVEDDDTVDNEDAEAKPMSSIAERYVTETTEEYRNSLAVQIAEMRINATGSRPIAWEKIREEFGLHNDQFYEVIRLSKGYRDAVIARIKTLKAQEGGWEYNGKLGRLTGIDNIEDFLK